MLQSIHLGYCNKDWGEALINYSNHVYVPLSVWLWEMLQVRPNVATINPLIERMREEWHQSTSPHSHTLTHTHVHWLWWATQAKRQGQEAIYTNGVLLESVVHEAFEPRHTCPTVPHFFLALLLHRNSQEATPLPKLSPPPLSSS